MTFEGSFTVGYWARGEFPEQEAEHAVSACVEQLGMPVVSVTAGPRKEEPYMEMSDGDEDLYECDVVVACDVDADDEPVALALLRGWQESVRALGSGNADNGIKHAVYSPVSLNRHA